MMKSFVVIGSILAASQCAPEPSGEPGPAKQDAGKPAAPGPPEAKAADVGVAPDASTKPGAWLVPGPPPFTVPTVVVPLGELGVTARVPAGTRVQPSSEGLLVVLGEGSNFAMYVSDSAADLADVRAMLNSETIERPGRSDEAVVWDEGGRWYFQYSGAVSCWNPGDARHDAGDVEVMIASCRTIENAE